MKIIGISGSISGSKTYIAVKTVLHNISKYYPDLEVELINLKDYKLDFCDGRDFIKYSEDTLTVVDKILSADTLIIGTPIYKASIPGALKNLIDLLPLEALENKVVGVVSTGGSSKHHLVIEYQLKPILSFLKCKIVPQYVFIEENHFNSCKEIIDEEIRLRLEKLATDTISMSDNNQSIIVSSS